ncbi:TetR/AcrR family transcriptional regulator [Pseudonocardia nematodicida]|uniref:TetR/AcrR family transcriptional regulator n=2 Tax=Pseudonocardia nematodicida TaxID=1206997 RepID=A0ABV1KE96_9PSEU
MDKRRAIMSGALGVFARDGYARASIDAISSAAAVSTRTIYNHFADKEELFRTVIRESSAQVAEAQFEIIERHLEVDGPAGLEEALVAFGLEWATPTPEYADHYALVRQINAEIEHIPKETVRTWQRTGPHRVMRDLAYRLGRLAERGLLDVDDPDRAALHLALLVSTTSPAYLATTLSPAEVEMMVRAGVRTFLHGHAPDQGRPMR